MVKYNVQLGTMLFKAEEKMNVTIDRGVVLAALIKTDGDHYEAARLLEIHHDQLLDKIKEYNLQKQVNDLLLLQEKEGGKQSGPICLSSEPPETLRRPT
jgi:hypothetical protein